MKVRLLPLAISAAIAMPGIALANGPTVYGKMNVTVGYVKDKAATSNGDYNLWQLKSYDSRLGVKGDETISDSLTAFYQAEFGINVDSGGDSGTPFSQRNIFVGLKGGWGALQLGKFDTPLKSSQGKLDEFNDTSGDLKHAFDGSLGENRASNLIQYTSPKIADTITATVAVQPGENQCPNSQTARPCNNGIADGISAAVAFSSNGLYAAIAHDKGIASKTVAVGDNTAWDTSRVTATYAMDQFEAGAMYQTGEQSDPATGLKADKQDGYVLSGGFKLDSANKLKLQYAASTFKPQGDSANSTDYKLLAFGYDNLISKQTKLYAQYTVAKKEPKVTKSTETDTLEFGIDHKF